MHSEDVTPAVRTRRMSTAVAVPVCRDACRVPLGAGVPLVGRRRGRA